MFPSKHSVSRRATAHRLAPSGEEDQQLREQGDLGEAHAAVSRGSATASEAAAANLRALAEMYKLITFCVLSFLFLSLLFFFFTIVKI